MNQKSSRRVYAIDATTPALPLMCAQAKRPPEDAVADAVVTHVARDRRRYALRLSGAAACSQQLRSSRSPGASAIFDLHTLWRASASENPDPSVIARTQFVTAFRARLSGGPRRAAAGPAVGGECCKGHYWRGQFFRIIIVTDWA